ncbi:MAG TPA: hypothetical protein ENH33_07310 [Actinobacteria bacterium]|nr:hypothetical protein [Actinomycetota bacterium]
MKATDEVEFGTMISTLGAAFGTAIEPAMIEAYFMALEDIDIDVVGAACKEAIRTCEFFPRPVNIRNLVICGNRGLAAAEAWDKMVGVCHGVQGTSVSRKDHPTDELANRAMKLLGRMGLASDWEGPWAMKRFIELYEMLHDRKQAEDRALAAVGGARMTEISAPTKVIGE